MPSSKQAKLIAARLLLNEANWGKLGIKKNAGINKASYQLWLETSSNLLSSLSDLDSFNTQLKKAQKEARVLFKALKY